MKKPIDEKARAARRSQEQPKGKPITSDPRWNLKQGKPKDRRMEKTVERASGRYSASEQSEKSKSSRE
jgi:hypothetical protein